MNKLTSPKKQYNKKLLGALNNAQSKISDLSSIIVEGKLTRMVGLTMEAVGCEASVGSQCLVEGGNNKFYEAEVVGFSGNLLYLMPISSITGIVPGARVIPTNKTYQVDISMDLLGRV